MKMILAKLLMKSMVITAVSSGLKAPLAMTTTICEEVDFFEDDSVVIIADQPEDKLLLLTLGYQIIKYLCNTR